MHAIFQTGGKQYLVKVGDKIQVEKLEGQAGDILKFDQVLFTSTGDKIELGKPFISGSTVEGKILKQGRAKKVHVLKYRPKSKYRRKSSNRQHYTEVEITKA